MKGGDYTNERLKEIRKILSMSQEELGSRLGVTGTAISRLEKGERKITEQMILAIVRELNVNEDYLRHGIGEPFIELSPEDEYTMAAAELSRDGDKIAMQAVIEYWKLDEDSKKVFRDFLLHIVENSNKKE